MFIIKHYIILICILLTTSCSDQTPNLIPREILFEDPDKTSVSISPDGKYLSYLAPLDGVLNIFIAPIDDISQARAVTDQKTQKINSYYWSKNSKHIIYKQNTNGDENYYLYSYDLANNSTRLLTPKSGVKAIIYKIGKDDIIFGLNQRDMRYFDVYKVNLQNFNQELILKNNRFSGFAIDDNLNIRFGVLIDQNGNKKYYQKSDKDWDLFLDIPAEDISNTKLINFDPDSSNAYFLDSRGSNTSVLKKINLNTKKAIILAKNELADINIFTSHPVTKHVQAISINYDKKSYQVLDPAIAQDLNYLSANKYGWPSILKRSLDDNVWLVSYSSDTHPMKYYLYNRANKNLKFLFSSKPKLDKYSFFPMHPVIIKSRDGLDLVSYVTLPTNAKLQNSSNKPSPLVLLVHGGPWNRDSFGFNTLHQWLANRGYAVLSVNFRGSSGFGKKFLNAGNMEWGKKMQDDLTDAVNWAIENKVAQAEKICIMGSSYGGYAVLSALVNTPDVFACGIDIVGPSNLLTLLNSLPKSWLTKSSIYKMRIGPWETEEDKKSLKDRSPLFFASQIKKPLLIAHGANDPRVKLAESEQIVSALQKYDIPVTYIVYENEGHGFTRPENRLSFYAQAEKFLSEILGGKLQPIK